ncbi:MAG: M23 family metallopeptidase [Oscillospiraceae bacterium]|nr:M23 family metallopeptidase [Oscillospiraceae bacterium]
MYKSKSVSKKNKPGEARPMRRRLIRLCVCVCVLAAAFIVKNTGTGELLRQVYFRISRDVDYVAAFETAGQKLSGGDGVAQAVMGLYDDIFITENSAAQQREVLRLQEHYAATQRQFARLDVPVNVEDGYTELAMPTCLPAIGEVTDGFGYREHPVTGETAYHYGTDIAGALGDSVYAFAEGEVTAVGQSSIDGLFVKVAHADGTVSMYGHCDSVLVSRGDAVTMGEQIAVMGQSGNATGPCLHFELLKDGMYLNPTFYIGELI